MAPNFDLIPSQSGMQLKESNNMSSNPIFSHLYELNTCFLDALNLANRSMDDWDSNLEFFHSTRDFCPSYDILVYDACFGWIPDIWDFIGVKKNNSYDLFLTSLLLYRNLHFLSLWRNSLLFLFQVCPLAVRQRAILS